MSANHLARAGLVALVAFGVLAASDEARAAGLYVSDRGVRPLGRAGAFVAGADDLGAIWYNPAGIVDTPTSVLLDGSWVHYTDTFARQALAMSAQGTTYVQSYPSVNGTTPFLPIPTLAGSFRWGPERQYAVALGIYAPDAALLTYPTLVGNNEAAPQRYSLISLGGSILAVIGGWFSYKPIEAVRVGVGVQALTGYFRTTVDFSACPPENLVCAGQDPNYDAFTALKAGPIFAPSANAGVTIVPSHLVRIGVSGQAPFVVNAATTVDVRLPTATVFDNAYQQGNRAHLHLELPPVLRVGVELRPGSGDDLRIEVAYVREFWSVEKSLDITPEDIQLYKISGFPSPFGVDPISLPRGMQDSSSFRLGGEYRYTRFVARAGIAYETTAVPTAYVAPLTVDSGKLVTSIGGSVVVNEHLRLDAVLSHTFEGSVTVTPEQAAVPLINPVKGNPTQSVTVNGGNYTANLWVLGGGLEYRF